MNILNIVDTREINKEKVDRMSTYRGEIFLVSNKIHRRFLSINNKIKNKSKLNCSNYTMDFNIDFFQDKSMKNIKLT